MSKPRFVHVRGLNGWAVVLIVIATTHAASAQTVQFEIDGGNRRPISPFIYGTNQPNWQRDGALYTLARWGGNRITAYNWENNASNAGVDWHNQNDAFLSKSDVPGEPIRLLVTDAYANNAAVIVTVPILGLVAADKQGDGDVAQTSDYLHKRFIASQARKNLRFGPPDVLDARVFQDEFVNWLETTFPNSRRDPMRTIFYALDNEPELWPTTHARLHPDKTRYEEIVRLNVEYAAAIKAVAPKSLIFGPVSYGWQGFCTFQDAPDAQQRDFLDFYLQQMREAQKKSGQRLLDVLDVHWYPEARAGTTRITGDEAGTAVSAARIEAPRSLWDPHYLEDSWITKESIREPIQLLARLRKKIDKNYPGTRLAISEYYYGGGNDISGALAQADVLGIFGREGLFAAALWHLGKTDDRFIRAAFAMYRNYDGQGGAFGDVGLACKTTDPEHTSVYASVDAKQRVIIVAINKGLVPLLVEMRLRRTPATRFAAIYQLTADRPQPTRINDTLVDPAGRLHCELPARSVSTLVLISGRADSGLPDPEKPRP